MILIWSLLDQFILKKYLPFSRFFSGLNNGLSLVSSLFTSNPNQEDQKEAKDKKEIKNQKKVK